MITPSLPGAAMGWVLFWGPGWLRRCGSGWGLAAESPCAGAEPPRLPQGRLPAAGPSFPVGSLLAAATGRPCSPLVPPGPTEAAPRPIPRGAVEASSSLVVPTWGGPGHHGAAREPWDRARGQPEPREICHGKAIGQSDL